MINLISLLSTAASAVTGGSLSRFVATAIVSGSLGAWGAWQVQQWRWKANTQQEQIQRDQAALARAKMLDDKRAAAIENTTQAEVIYAAKTKTIKKYQASTVGVHADLVRVLNSAVASCPSGQGVRNGQPPGSFDASDTRWQLDRRGASAD